MKKFYVLAMTAGLFLAACDNVETTGIDEPQGEKITQTVKVSVADFNGIRTKVAVSTEGEFSWSAGDQLGVFPLQTTLDAAGQTSQQIMFRLNSDTPATTATFTGTGWGLVTGSTYKYFAYYPYSADAQHGEATVKYTDNLNQVANNSTSHLGVNDFLYAPCIEPATIEEAEFQFKHISALVDFKITVPQEYKDKSFSKVVLSAASPIFTVEGTYNPSTATASAAPEVTTTVPTDKITLKLNGGNGFAADENYVIDAWFLMAPVAFDNTTVTVEVYTRDGDYFKNTKVIENALDPQDFVQYDVVVSRSALGGTDLSANGTANCYQVRQAGMTYSFLADVKGNGYDPVDAANHNADAAIDVAQATGAVVLWETVNTDEAPQVGTIIKSASLEGNSIYITTADEFTEGNALVSLYKDGEGGTADQYDAEYDEILWSWHIWATNVDFDATAQDLDGASMMDRNLGALSASKDEPGLALGFLYQWGRPFPIIGACADGDTKAIANKAMATTNPDLWKFDVESTEEIGTLAYSAQNPMTFVASNANADGTNSEGNWFYCGEDAAPSFWGEKKTMYDPCPIGWKIPGKNGTKRVVWENTFTTESATFVAGKGCYYNSNDSMFYPACGLRGSGGKANSSGPLAYASSTGIYWSSRINNYATISTFYFSTGQFYPMHNRHRAFGLSVRPCKDVTE